MTGNSSPTRGLLDGSKAYDEEGLDWAKSASRWSSWPKKSLQLLKAKKLAVGLLVFDIVITLLVVHAFEPLITLLRRNEELFGARLTLPLNYTAPITDPSGEVHRIPRILHQTSATSTVPDKWTDLRQSCLDSYSEFEYMHWTDESARDFIKAEYPWFVDTWDGYPFNIQRADAIRYFVLYHYGGIYLDMDTLCNETVPFDQIEANGLEHNAVFKSTTPTGVSNDFLITSARHPVYAAALSNLLFYFDLTRPWADWLPHAAIMISSGPFFLTMVMKHWMLQLETIPTPTVQVINATELLPYITDLEDASWHHGDTKTLMYVGDRPWIWFTLGGIGLAIGLHIINYLLLLALGRRGRLLRPFSIS